ncbi:MAG: thioredoxin [Alphaproteobacteria bacterium]|nr:thioredoxin [Alphaproteobacteria bacterium]
MQSSAPSIMPAPDKASTAIIKDGTTESFMVDVIEASQHRPVIVDFWAQWCGPCKQLVPALEKAVTAQNGKVHLVKVNVDENKELAAGLRVQSIPAVFVFYQGQPIDGFVGALPDSEIKKLVENLANVSAKNPEGANVASMLKQAEGFVAEGKLDHAQALFSAVLEIEGENPAAYTGLIKAFLAANNFEEAQYLFEQAPDAIKQDKAWAAVQTAFDLQEKMAKAALGADATAALKAKVDGEPANHQARYDYALALYAEGNREAAMDELLEIIRRDRKWNDEAARKELVTIFEALGPMDPLTIAARKRLSSILFA